MCSFGLGFHHITRCLGFCLGRRTRCFRLGLDCFAISATLRLKLGAIIGLGVFRSLGTADGGGGSGYRGCRDRCWLGKSTRNGRTVLDGVVAVTFGFVLNLR